MHFHTVCQSFGPGDQHYYLLKTDANGDTLWTRIFGAGMWDEGRSVQQTGDGGYILAGSAYSGVATGTDFYVIKTDSYGDTLWTRTYGGNSGDVAYCVRQTTDDGHIIVGFSASFGWGKCYAVRIDAFGDTLWTQLYSRGAAYSVQQTTDGGYIIAGRAEIAGCFDVYLVKTDANGDIIWSQTYDYNNNDQGYYVQETADGGYIIAGATLTSDVGWEMLVLKTDSYGDTIWTQTYGGYSNDEAWSAQETIDGGYIIAGFSWISGNRLDSYLVKTDAAGDMLWTKTYGGSLDDKAYSLFQTSDGDYVLTGSTKSFGSGQEDVWLIKVAGEQVGIGDENHSIPVGYNLSQNYPNPFNPTTTIS